MEKRVGGRLAVFAFVSLVVLIGLYGVSAVDKSASTAGANITNISSARLTTTPIGVQLALGGNVTHLNLSIRKSTVKWQGFFGGLSASLSLGNGSSVLYDFGSVNKDQIKTVFASTDSAFDFSKLSPSNGTAVDTAWNFVTAQTDSGGNTLANTAIIATLNTSAVALRAHNNAAFDSNRSLNTSIYRSGVFTDNVSLVAAGDFNAFAFGVAVNGDEFAFDNSTAVDFEMLVPVNGSATGGTQTYTFFLDIE